jgi:adenylylsulfate kinase-like enzyme
MVYITELRRCFVRARLGAQPVLIKVVARVSNKAEDRRAPKRTFNQKAWLTLLGKKDAMHRYNKGLYSRGERYTPLSGKQVSFHE